MSNKLRLEEFIQAVGMLNDAGEVTEIKLKPITYEMLKNYYIQELHKRGLPSPPPSCTATTLFGIKITKDES